MMWTTLVIIITYIKIHICNKIHFLVRYDDYKNGVLKTQIIIEDELFKMSVFISLIHIKCLKIGGDNGYTEYITIFTYTFNNVVSFIYIFNIYHLKNIISFIKYKRYNLKIICFK